MVDQVAEVVGDGTARHRGAPRRQPDAADEWVPTLTTAAPADRTPPTVTDMGPVLSVHVGAGAVGVCIGGDD